MQVQAASASALAQAFVGLFDPGWISVMCPFLQGWEVDLEQDPFMEDLLNYKKRIICSHTGNKSFDEKHWDLRDIIAMIDTSAKKTNSRDGMILSKNTCPREIYSNFVSVADLHIREIRSAIEFKNIKKTWRTLRGRKFTF